MMKIKIYIFSFLLVAFLSLPPSALADSQFQRKTVIHQFIKAFYENNRSKLDSLKEPSVIIPEIREQTPIRGFETLPSPRKNTLS
jgi:hypothetical protein